MGKVLFVFQINLLHKKEIKTSTLQYCWIAIYWAFCFVFVFIFPLLFLADEDNRSRRERRKEARLAKNKKKFNSWLQHHHVRYLLK